MTFPKVRRGGGGGHEEAERGWREAVPLIRRPRSAVSIGPDTDGQTGHRRLPVVADRVRAAATAHAQRGVFWVQVFRGLGVCARWQHFGVCGQWQPRMPSDGCGCDGRHFAGSGGAAAKDSISPGPRCKVRACACAVKQGVDPGKVQASPVVKLRWFKLRPEGFLRLQSTTRPAKDWPRTTAVEYPACACPGREGSPDW